MSILVMSDAGHRALKDILSITADKRFASKHSKVELVLSLGDTVERGYHPEEVINKLRELKLTLAIISLRGNHDKALL